MNNVELVKRIEEANDYLKNSVIKMLDDILISIDGYDALTDDAKSICRVFLSISIMYRLSYMKGDLK